MLPYWRSESLPCATLFFFQKTICSFQDSLWDWLTMSAFLYRLLYQKVSNLQCRDTEPLHHLVYFFSSPIPTIVILYWVLSTHQDSCCEFASVPLCLDYHKFNRSVLLNAPGNGYLEQIWRKASTAARKQAHISMTFGLISEYFWRSL